MFKKRLQVNLSFLQIFMENQEINLMFSLFHFFISFHQTSKISKVEKQQIHKISCNGTICVK